MLDWDIERLEQLLSVCNRHHVEECSEDNGAFRVRFRMPPTSSTEQLQKVPVVDDKGRLLTREEVEELERQQDEAVLFHSAE